MTSSVPKENTEHFYRAQQHQLQTKKRAANLLFLLSTRVIGTTGIFGVSEARWPKKGYGTNKRGGAGVAENIGSFLPHISEGAGSEETQL
jgi:hypothetical protein